MSTAQRGETPLHCAHGAYETTCDVVGFVDPSAYCMAVCFVGFSTFVARPLINIHDLAVMPAYRQQGVGRLLLERVEATGQELGGCKLTLEVRADNHPAQRLYQHVGFQHREYGGEATRVWFLEKRL